MGPKAQFPGVGGRLEYSVFEVLASRVVLAPRRERISQIAHVPTPVEEGTLVPSSDISDALRCLSDGRSPEERSRCLAPHAHT